MFIETTATRKVKVMTKRIRALPGGTSASKTISVLLVLIALAQTDKVPTITSIVSESMPHLKKGAIRDFKRIMQEHNYWKRDLWNETDKIYTFETGSVIEFFGVESWEKVKGGRRDRGFANEANNISFNAFEELEVRTKEFFYLDWNPNTEFWYYTEVKPHRNDVEELTLTYKDNEGLDQRIVDSIEQRKNRKGWWQVYGLGQLGEVEGRIYTGWKIIDKIPHEAKLMVRGLDFGYTNDPTVITDIYYYDGGYIWDERLYQKGMNNKPIADFLLNLENPKTLVIADSAEPKSIAEIKGYGVNIIGVTKGKDSVKQGIDFVQSQKISVTSTSVDTIRCYRNYLWKVDKDGKTLNDPEHDFSDPMDAGRYGMTYFNRPKETSMKEYKSSYEKLMKTMI